MPMFPIKFVQILTSVLFKMRRVFIARLFAYCFSAFFEVTWSLKIQLLCTTECGVLVLTSTMKRLTISPS